MFTIATPSTTLRLRHIAVASWFAVCLILPVLAQQEPTGAASDQPKEKKAAASTQPSEHEEMEPPREPSASDILKALTKPEDAPPKPVILPSQPGQTIERKEIDLSVIPQNSVAPITPRLYPDGYRIVDRPGRLAREGEYYVFAFESRGQAEAELPIRLLPNRLLEDMEIASAGGTSPIVFLISGELTEYHGVNYLLVQKLLTRPNLGNLK